ncbi:MAG: amino acid racemase [Myxococcota bacterium]
MNVDPHWNRTIGILGGMGPWAHVELERRLLDECRRRGCSADRDFPSWVVCSTPSIPDRTAALLGRGPTPRPALGHGLRRLARAGADFAVVPCNTAHAWLEDPEFDSPLPVLDMVEHTLRSIESTHGPRATVGVLATTGTLRTDLHRRCARRAHPAMTVRSLLDHPVDEPLHRRVMEAIYGAGNRVGLKSGPPRGTELSAVVELLAPACRALADNDVVILGCTELSMLTSALPHWGPEWIDPLSIIARTALDRASRPS